MVCLIRFGSARRWLRFSVLSLCFLGFAGAVAQAAEKGPEVPLIDRGLFFADPQIAGPQVSPDGSYISFLKPLEGVMNVWVKRFNQPFDEAWPVTADDKRPVRGYFWSQDSAHILHVQDQGGDENFHIYAVNPLLDIRKSDTPKPKDLTPAGKVRAFIYAVPKSDPDHILIGLNERDQRLHDVYKLSLATGERELLIKNEIFASGWVADLTGKIRVAIRQTPDGGTQFLNVENNTVKDALYQCNYLETCFPVRFHKDGKHLYFVSDEGASTNLSRLMLVDVEKGEISLVESDPEKRVNFGDAIFSEKTDELLVTSYNDERVRLNWHNQEAKKRWEALKARLPDGELRSVSVSRDETRRLLGLFSDTNPGAVYSYDEQTDTLSKLYDSRPELPSESLAPRQPVTYKSRDGVDIPAYLTLPRVANKTNLPAVILPHGGPWARDSWGYDSFAQFLANRGYAVLQPNFRGSTGYGKEFLNAGNKEWGTGIMQNDISDGVEYLTRLKIADPKRIAIMGGSYGGYATLAGVTFTPNLYAAGVSIVGPSNLLTLLSTIPPYWEPMKKTFAIRVGDMETEEGKAQLKAQSPYFHAKQIKVPMLIVQGANDPRVKQDESDQIVVALRDAKQPVEYLLAENEGHGYANENNRMAMFAAIEKFLATHIGGRYQDSISMELAEILRGLEVDVNTVTIAAPIEEVSPEEPAKLPWGLKPTQ